jgi:hypothetical protein
LTGLEIMTSNKIPIIKKTIKNYTGKTKFSGERKITIREYIHDKYKAAIQETTLNRVTNIMIDKADKPYLAIRHANGVAIFPIRDGKNIEIYFSQCDRFHRKPGKQIVQ